MLPHKTLARLAAAGLVTVAAAEVRGLDPPPAAPAFRAAPVVGSVPGWRPQFRPGPGADDGWKPAATEPLAASPPAAEPQAAPSVWKPAVTVGPPPAPAPAVTPAAAEQPAPTPPVPPPPGLTPVPVTEVEPPAEPVPAPEPAAPPAASPPTPVPGPAVPDPEIVVAQPTTPSQSQPPGTGTSSTGPAATGTPAAGGGQPSAPQPPQTWHGHKYPVQPLAPAGAAPVAPTGPGFYTLLAQARGELQEKPPRWPYPRNGAFQPPFNEIDFTYLDKIPFEERDWAERLKRIPIGDHWLFSTGGEARYRYNSETNSRLSGSNNTYDLFRTRLYTDVWYEDYFRVYTEFLYGDTWNQDLAPLTRDVNRGDFQQLFVDLKLLDVDGNPVYFRAGRQELLYGSQRLVSTVDWGNNRPRYDGLKAFYRSEKLDVDAFLTRPVQVRFGQLDPSDHNQTFSGLWTTYKPKKGTFLDVYYLNLENDNPGVARGQSRTGSFNISTLGARYYGKFDSGLLLDFEGMQQFGHWADQTVLAQALSAYLGWNFKDCWATPTVWAGYDYASGDPNPNNTGQHRTFNQLFGFGHYYFGFIDVVARQNIRDWNVQAYAYPVAWLTTGVQYHVFRLDSNADALYSAAGAVLRQDRTGRAGDDVGSELDLLTNFHLTDRQDVFLSYSHLFTGRFIRATGPGFPCDYVYVQYSLRW